MTSPASGYLPEVGSQFREIVRISEDLVRSYIAVCGDDAPVHLDAEFARTKGFDGPICHGMLLGSFVSTVLGTRLPGRHSVIKTIARKFRNAVTYPCTVQFEIQVVKVFESVGMVRLEIVILSEHGVLLGDGTAECIVK